MRPIPELSGFDPIRIDGKFDDWKGVAVEYRDTIGDNAHRDYMGYGGLHYKNNSGRNDIINAKVAVDEETLYFWVESRKPLTPHNGSNWMLFLLDADKNPDTGWHGYDFLVNKRVASDRKTTLCRYDAKATGQWVEVTELDYRYAGQNLEIAVPRKLLGLTGDAFTFDFHWCDNFADLKDPISLCINGDSAPNRRFNYRCVWRKIK
ncbi:MAG: hypothetical protein R6V06_08205 [Kiritimatiellia bacterium]